MQYSTSDFRKGLKVQIDGEPYLMSECNFVKPGKGNALYKCRLKNLIRGTTLDRTYRGGETLESADVEETDVQFLYKQGETWVFMDNDSFEQYELDADAVGDGWKYLKDGMKCMMTLFNGNPLDMTPPRTWRWKSPTASRAPRATQPPTSPSPPRLKPARRSRFRRL